ncbi:S8 family peptidase [Thomasclavelia cocleata]|uniref:S8 family peptidase n=1 Tax=Thomasclavelia cocleata TaxID=69824 RepID=UPI00255A7410|nr:S8 family peptidase [Thomasclavelia cocleata]
MYDKYEIGKVIIAVNEKISFDEIEFYISIALENIEYEKIEIIFSSSMVMAKNDAENIILIYLKDKNPTTVIKAIEKLSLSPYINYAEPDYLEEMHLVSNDPLYNYLWGIQKVNAPLAWNYTTGSSEVVVGVIDTGIDYNHQDIAQNMWVSPNANLFYGWNFADNDDNSIDTDGHGSHVAGTIGAVGNNGIGIAGVCWNVRVASLKFGLDIASAIAAIDFANNFNIQILNASWGGRAYSYSLEYAIENYNGLFIASAGNNGTNNDIEPIYPASYESDNIISVAATDPYDTLARFSNHGVDSVDIAAPGTDILSLDLYGGYSPLNGTSMAAPHAALLKSYMPNISTLSLKNIILSSVDKNSNLNGKISTGGLLNIDAMFSLAKYWQ